MERWNPHRRIRQDLFGFADLLCIYGEGGAGGSAGSIAAVQVTSTRVAERVRKILNEPKALTWLLAGGRILVHGWRKIKRTNKDGSYAKNYRYDCREIEMTVTDFWQAWLEKRYR